MKATSVYLLKRLIWLILLILLATLLLPGQPLEAQTGDGSYWRYAAARRLTHVIPADINNDGIDEFLVAAENGEIDLLNANNATLEWSYDAGGVIQALNSINIDGEENPEREVILVTGSQMTVLTLLDHLGQEIWRIDMAPIDETTNLPIDIESDPLTYVESNLDTRQIAPLDADGDGREEIAVLFKTGQLYLYSSEGEFLRQISQNSQPNIDRLPHLQIGDLNQDGRDEIVIGLFNPEKKFSELHLYNANGDALWHDAPPISGHITDMELVPFGPDQQLQIAVGTDRGHIHLYDFERQRQWLPRTLNKPITDLAMAPFPEGPALLAGTDAGLVVVYNAEGRRLWTSRMTSNADRAIIGLSTLSFVPPQRVPAMAVMLGPSSETGGRQLIKLLDISGLEVGQFEAGEDAIPLSHLLDVNGDQHSELLLTRFANVTLQGLGLGVSQIAKEVDYSLDAEPGAVLVVDFNNDGRDELLLGGQNGKLHYLIDGTNLEWLQPPGGAISHLALLKRENLSNVTQSIVVGRNNFEADPADTDTPVSWIELHNTNGVRLWDQPFHSLITAVAVNNANSDATPEIIVGTEAGEIIVLNASGSILWQSRTAAPENGPEPIKEIITITAPSGDPQIIAATETRLYQTNINEESSFTPIITLNDASLKNIFPLNQPGVEFANRIFVLSDNALGLNWHGESLSPWPLQLGGLPLTAIEANDPFRIDFDADSEESFLISTQNDDLVRLTIKDNQPEIQWEFESIADVTTLYWGDLDGNRLPEFVTGNASGNIRLYSSVPQPKFLDELELSSGVFAMTALRRGIENRSDLLVVTENGEVQIFSTQENHPPLLTSPNAEINRGQYGFNISVSDVEEDSVLVRLDIQDPATGLWETQRETVIDNGNGPVFWDVIDPPASEEGVRYRFFYNDKLHSGFIYPPIGPLPPASLALADNQLVISMLIAVLTGGIMFVIARQFQSPTWRTRRFYWRLKRWPDETLIRLEKRYNSTDGAPDFLLALSGLARQREDELISSLADGLFLLADRPLVGLPFIAAALDAINKLEPRWQDIDKWLLLFKTGEDLLTLPTLTELSLEHPQLEEMLDRLEQKGYWSSTFQLLLPILTTIRDSDRVDSAEDRLVYLNEARSQLQIVANELPEYDTSIEKPLAIAIADRWAGLVRAEREELHGRAYLEISLKTKRLIPGEPSQITFDIENTGRAPAENLIAELDDDPAYASGGMPEVISFLPPGHTRQVAFDLRPLVSDRFRVAMTVTFDDRNRINKRVAFGDMVHLLQPQIEFSPIPNEYRPGTPLRQNSSVFYGRQRLFNFIAENAAGSSSQTQRNVLILIGQRRTGKTSALLNLEKHLPAHLLPVYIDCQSLGVLPGMGALFHDWAWLIADALATRDIEIDVPDLGIWETDPVGQFQRRFLPTVRSLLPEETTLLLVFDEFEVFENLVNDGILPPNFFNFLRHLMQHSEGLSFVFVGTRHLEEMSADYWSVLFNIALYQRISYLREEAATKLITEPVSPYLVYDDLALDKILRVTAGHPYFLQLVCYTLVKQANNQRKGYVTISDVNAALDEMLSLGEVHFAYLWQRSTFTERAILTAVSHMLDQDRPFHPKDFVQFLDPYGIHLQATEVTAALNTLVEREIMAELPDGPITLYELRLGLVGLWTAQHKSLSKLHATKANGAAKNGKARKIQPVPDNTYGESN